MTESTGATHLDLDALADLLAGEGTDAQVDHVASCAGCAGRLDELSAADAEVAAVLAALPAPPVPAGLADRLQAALAAEPPLTPVEPSFPVLAPVAGDAPARSAGPATVTPFPRAAQRQPRRWVPAVAAAAVLLAGGTLGGAALLSGGGLGGGDDSSDTAASAGGGNESAADPLAGLAVSETGTDYSAEGTLAGALPSLLSGGATAAAAPAPPPPEAAAPEDEALAADSAQPQTEQRAMTSVGLDRLRDPAALASCLQALLPPEDDALRPLALDYASYGGSPALVVVLPATDTADKVDVFVVGPDCAVGNDSTLFFTRLDRP